VLTARLVLPSRPDSGPPILLADEPRVRSHTQLGDGLALQLAASWVHGDRLADLNFDNAPEPFVAALGNAKRRDVSRRLA
jgi:hypothetical protein